MRRWFEKGWFSQDLPLRRCDSSEFVPLGSLFTSPSHAFVSEPLDGHSKVLNSTFAATKRTTIRSWRTWNFGTIVCNATLIASALALSLVPMTVMLISEARASARAAAPAMATATAQARAWTSAWAWALAAIQKNHSQETSVCDAWLQSLEQRGAKVGRGPSGVLNGSSTVQAGILTRVFDFVGVKHQHAVEFGHFRTLDVNSATGTIGPREDRAHAPALKF